MAKVALRGLKGRLVNSSIDAYVLALETINRLSVRYRIEAFTFLITNAWELLLKANLIEITQNPRSIILVEQRSGKRGLSASMSASGESIPIRMTLFA